MTQQSQQNPLDGHPSPQFLPIRHRFRRYRHINMKLSLSCVVQNPWGQVFVSSPS